MPCNTGRLRAWNSYGNVVLIERFKYQISLSDAEGIIFPYEYEHEITDPRIYVAGNNVPMGASHHRDRIFLTVPRRRPGIPATLNFVNTKALSGNTSPSFIPFPNLQTNELHVCENQLMQNSSIYLAHLTFLK